MVFILGRVQQLEIDFLYRQENAEGGIRTHDLRGRTGLANLRLTRLGNLDLPSESSVILDAF